MKKLNLILLIILIKTVAFAQQKVYNIVNYGAKPDGTTNSTLAIQKTIDEAYAHGGGIVLIPAGSFVTGVIYLKSNIEFHLAEKGNLLATTNRIDYGPKKASALIVANNLQNVSITGKGVINGQAALLLKDIYRMLNNGTLQDAEWKKYNDWGQMRPAEDNRPHLINFTNCNQVNIKGITIKNGLCWIQDYQNCSNMVIDSIQVESNTFLNNDGIDLVDCKNVKLTNSFFNVADDGICLKSSDPKSVCENIYIANCKIRSSASAFKLGTASRGGFKKIIVRNIQVYDTYRSAIALETVDGGAIEDVDIRNVTAKNTGNAIFIRLGQRNKNADPGTLRNVYIGDLKVEVPSGKPDKGYSMEGPEVKFPHNVFPSSITGIPGHHVQNVTLDNIEITYSGGAKMETAYFGLDSLEKIPEKTAGYPEFSMFGELPAWGFYVRHADGITMKNIRLSYQKSDFRAACIFDDVSRLALNNLVVKEALTIPVIVLNKVTKPTMQKVSIPGGDKKAILIR